MSEPVNDTDEYGRPVSDRYQRLGTDDGIYVRFEPGFGLNVHIGHRKPEYGPQPIYGGSRPLLGYKDDPNEFAMSIGGWERLCEMADEWRARIAPEPNGEHP